MAMPTLLDIAKANGSDAVAGLIDETSKATPEIALGGARTIKGINYRTLVRTALPGVSFRSANEGVTPTKGQYENRLVETYIFDPRWECDKAVADSYEDGAAAYIALEAEAVMAAAMQYLASQFYYGTANDAKGFPGLMAAYDPTTMEVDAEGSTASTGSSLWAVRFGLKDVTWVWGQDGALALSDVMTARLTDGNAKPYTGYVQEILARPGLQVGNKRCVGRIKDLTADSTKGLTDAKIAQLLAKFPVGLPPTHFFCSRRSLMQLQSSRTATTATGAPAPIPSEAFGVPIHVTDAITDTETLT